MLSLTFLQSNQVEITDSWDRNSGDRCGPEVNMWGPLKPQGRYDEVTQRDCIREKKKAGEFESERRKKNRKMLCFEDR